MYGLKLASMLCTWMENWAVRENRWGVERDEAICSTSYEGHTNWVNDVLLVNGVLASCSSDRTIKLWDAAGCYPLINPFLSSYAKTSCNVSPCRVNVDTAKLSRVTAGETMTWQGFVDPKPVSRAQHSNVGHSPYV